MEEGEKWTGREERWHEGKRESVRESGEEREIEREKERERERERESSPTEDTCTLFIHESNLLNLDIIFQNETKTTTCKSGVFCKYRYTLQTCILNTYIYFFGKKKFDRGNCNNGVLIIIMIIHPH
jgi:hypothetical protein